MNSRKLIPSLLGAVACVALALTPAAASAASGHGGSKGKKTLRIDSVRVATKLGPLTLRVAADVQTELKIKVNGRRVTTPFEMAGAKAQIIELRSTDGLHAGTNNLQITGSRFGVISRTSRSVKVPRWALLADAGEDTPTPTHIHARVGTVALPGAAQGADVDYRWDIVQRPRKTKAKLADADDPRAVLEAQQPGTYVLQEEANPEGDAVPSSFDQVTVNVTPNDPPIGVPINTLTDDNMIKIGDNTYGGAGSGTNYVVLSRTTRDVLASGTAANTDAGMKSLLDLVQKYGSNGEWMENLIILSGKNGIPADQLDTFSTLLKRIGAALPSAENFLALRVGLPFSVIGLPGDASNLPTVGSATIRIPGGDYNPPISGAIEGYLQPNQANAPGGTPRYEYVAGAQPSFDTKAPLAAGKDSEKANKMIINGQSYEASLPGGATAGFHLVVLESLSLRPISNQMLVTNNASGSNRALQAETGKALAAAINKPGGPTVFLQSVGHPKGAGPEWQEIVKPLVGLGANAELIDGLDGTNGYALVARYGAQVPPAESSNAYDFRTGEIPTYPTPRLEGTLVRSRSSNYVPNLTSTPTDKAPKGTVDPRLGEIAYQTPQGWEKLSGTEDEAAKAEKSLCEGIEECGTGKLCMTLRECYWRDYGENWAARAGDLERVKYPGDGHGFTATTFTADQKALAIEASQVGKVQDYLERVQRPYKESALQSYVDLQGIGDKIYKSVQAPAESNAKAWTLGLISKALSVGGFAGPPISAAAAGLSASFGLASYLSNKAGQPILGDEIKSTSAKLGNQMLERINLARQASTRLGMILVSDGGKLSAAVSHISDKDVKLPAEIQPTIDAYTTAAKQWFYEALIPTAYPYLMRLNAPNARDARCQVQGIGWPNQPDYFQEYVTVGWDTDGNPIKANFFFTRGIGGAASPPSSIGNEMFRPATGPNPGLGIEKLQFFSPRVFGNAVTHALTNTRECSVGFLPRYQ